MKTIGDVRGPGYRWLRSKGLPKEWVPHPPSNRGVSGVTSTLLFCGICFVWFCNSLAGTPNPSVLEFRATGVLKGTAVTSDGTLVQYTNPFTVTCAGSNYSFVVLGSRPGSPSLASRDCLFDGSNTYLFSRYDPNYLTTESYLKINGRLIKHQLSRPARSKNSANVEITPGPICARRESTIMFLWIAFYAQHHYAGQGFAEQPAILSNLHDESRISPLRTEWNCLPDWPNFVKAFMQFERNPDRSLQRSSTSNPKELINPGVTNLAFEVLQWTNIDGSQFPRHLALHYSSALNGLGKNSSEKLNLEAWVEHVVFGPVDAAFVPLLQTNVLFRDFRLAQGDQPFSYFSTSGRVESLASLRNRPDYSRFISMHPIQRSAMSRIVLLLLMFLVLSLPLVQWVRKRVFNTVKDTRRK